jgi:hypothetical protein
MERPVKFRLIADGTLVPDVSFENTQQGRTDSSDAYVVIAVMSEKSVSVT